MRIWKFFLKSNRVFKDKEVVSNLHVCSNDLGKMWPSYSFHFSSSHRKVFNIFFSSYISVCPTINFQLSIISKWLANHISTNVFFKTAIRKKHVYIDIGWPWIWNRCFYLGIWNDGRTKMIVLPWFQVAIRLNSKKNIENGFINELWHINLYMNIGISNWPNWRFNLS